MNSATRHNTKNVSCNIAKHPFLSLCVSTPMACLEGLLSSRPAGGPPI
jgi:hypothetical protein